MNSRLEVISNHLNVNEGNCVGFNPVFGRPHTASPDDIVVITSKRTAVCKAKRGSFRNCTPDMLLSPLIREVLAANPKVPKDKIGDVVIGEVLPRSSQGATEVRVAALMAGLPVSVPCQTLNRQCSSGLQAIASVAASLHAGMYEFGLAGGVETMSQHQMGAWDGGINEAALADPLAQGCFLSMGMTSENVAQRFGITRQQQDQAAETSHARALRAQQNGAFDAEIVPIEVEVEEKDGSKKKVRVGKDEGPRPGTTAEKLAKLRPAFSAEGSTTAGNASQVSDGASVTLLCRRETAARYGLQIMGVFRGFSAVGVEPAIMGVGPAEAIPDVLQKCGLRVGDVDLFEVNEAFASQYVYCAQKLGLDMEKVNVNGGAMALGHPLGCTGSRMTATLLHEMHRRGARYGVVSMCIGSGMGAAAVFEVEN